MSKVTLNADMGESFGIYDFGHDEGLMEIVDVANVACGFHASDFTHMHRTVRLAKAHGVAVGAHPSLPDRQGFGRREMKMSREELADCILYQVGALTAFLRTEGMALSHIKPHGALYGMAARDPEVAHAVADAAIAFGVPVFGLPGTPQEVVLADRGVRMIPEFFADLEYDAAGRLAIVRKGRNVDPALAASRTHGAIRNGILAGGRRFSIATVCVHSDRGNSVDVARAVAHEIESAAEAAGNSQLQVRRSVEGDEQWRS